MPAKIKRPKIPPLPPRIRVAKKLPAKNDAPGLLVVANALIEAPAAHPDLLPNPPHLTVLKSAAATLSDAISHATNSTGGGFVLLAVAQSALRKTIDLHAFWVQALADQAATPDQSATIIRAAGFEVWKKSVRPAKERPCVTNTTVAGTVALEAAPVTSAVLYLWEQSSDQTHWVSAIDTVQLKATVAGLTRGQTYYFRYRVFVRGVGYLAPSQALSVVVS